MKILTPPPIRSAGPLQDSGRGGGALFHLDLYGGSLEVHPPFFGGGIYGMESDPQGGVRNVSHPTLAAERGVMPRRVAHFFLKGRLGRKKVFGVGAWFITWIRTASRTADQGGRGTEGEAQRHFGAIPCSPGRKEWPRNGKVGRLRCTFSPTGVGGCALTLGFCPF